MGSVRRSYHERQRFVLAVMREPGEGKIIDGRNRYRACKELGREVATEEWGGEGDPTAFVVSLNLHRRHLTESQRSVIAAKIKPQFEAQARERQRASGGDRGNQYVKPKLNTTSELWTIDQERQRKNRGEDPIRTPELPVRANLPEPVNARPRDYAANLLNVSPRSVESAFKVKNNGVPELVEAVNQGTIKVSTAAVIADLPTKEQAEIVAEGPQAAKARSYTKIHEMYC